jgi:O-methyltransferase
VLAKLLKRFWQTLEGDPYWRYRLAERVSRWIDPSLRVSEYGRRWPRDEAFHRALLPFEGRGNTRALDRKWMLDQSLKLVRGVAGDTAECGTWRGGSSWLICKGLSGLGKTHHAFDSFEGVSQPGPRDGAHFRKGDLAESEAALRARLAEFPDVRTYKGWIPSRFPDVADRRFCFVHVDVDLHQPTRDSIEFFYPRLTRGGVLLMDDYGFFICPGAREAADDFFKDKPEPVLELPTGQGLVLKA